MQSEPQSGFHDFMGMITEQWKNIWHKWAAVDEFANFDPSEIARIASDLSISSGELRFLAASDKGAADLLKRRLQTVQVDQTNIDPGVMRDLELHCAQCHSKKRCARELRNESTAAAWPKYCPNEQTIEAVTTQPTKKVELSN
jgi:Family of unknown function (DUF6455)